MYLDATSKYEKKTLNQLTFKPKQKVGIQKRQLMKSALTILFSKDNMVITLQIHHRTSCQITFLDYVVINLKMEEH